MKKIYQTGRLFTLLMLGFVCTVMAQSQNYNKRTYFNVDWQLNLPVGDDFANKFSGWGAQGEFGYFVTDMFSVGAFVGWHTNNKYIDRQTIQLSNTSAVTSDQQHSIFQIPFGAALRYTFTREGMISPYFGAKLGANYSEASTYLNIVKIYDKSWGFHVSPELGMTVYLTPDKSWGLHLATYYNYSTNKSHVLGYDIDGLNNWGVRVGVAF